jgi:hypothetical protein
MSWESQNHIERANLHILSLREPHIYDKEVYFLNDNDPKTQEDSLPHQPVWID